MLQKRNIFARWFFYLFFSVFYFLYSGFIKLLTILSKAVAKIRNNSLSAQKYFIKLPYFTHFYLLKLPYFTTFSPFKLPYFPHQQTVRWFFYLFFSVLYSLRSGSIKVAKPFICFYYFSHLSAFIFFENSSVFVLQLYNPLLHLLYNVLRG